MATTYLSRTPASAGSRTTWTFSAWIKRANTSTTGHQIFDCSPTPGTDESKIYFYNDFLYWKQEVGGGGADGYLVTNRKFRDVSAWYHIVCQWNTTDATDSERMKIWINGVQETSFSTNNLPDQNRESFINSANAHYIGSAQGTGSNFDGQMTHVHFIDGTAYDADTFGETDATTGIWKPKTTPSVTYGTNGFFLKFENSGAFGTDSSGNGNTFTVNGTMTQTIDTPSNVFATFNALNQQSSISYSNGNTTFTNSSSANRMAFSNLGVTKGKYYAEIKVGAISNYMRIGIADISKYIPVTNAYLTNISNSANYSNDGVIFIGSSSQGTFSTFTTNDIVNIALDMDNGYVYFGKNGTWQNSGDPTSGGSGTGGFAISNYLTETYCFGLSSFDGGTDNVANANFGNGYFGTTAVSSAENPDDGIGIFEYAVPTGYKALCTKSINAQEYD